MITGADLIALVLRDSGAFGTGQTPNGQDTLDTKQRLNIMIGEWNRARYLLYHLVDNSCAMNNALNYSVGPGGDINIPRPAQVKAAYVRQIVPSSPYPVDFPLTQIQSREDYSSIALKNQRGGPSQFYFFDSGYPLGHIYPWPLCNTQYELHIVTTEPLPNVDDLAAVILIPDEFQSALYWNMMVWSRNAYDLPPRQVDIARAKASLNTLRKASGNQVPSLGMPRALRRGGGYNVFSDQGN